MRRADLRPQHAYTYAPPGTTPAATLRAIVLDTKHLWHLAHPNPTEDDPTTVLYPTHIRTATTARTYDIGVPVMLFHPDADPDHIDTTLDQHPLTPDTTMPTHTNPTDPPHEQYRFAVVPPAALQPA